jgi:hypothetical protein
MCYLDTMSDTQVQASTGKTQIFQFTSRIVFVKIEQDETSINPLEDCDGMGHIQSLNTRHSNHISQGEFEQYVTVEQDNGWHFIDYTPKGEQECAVVLSYFEHGRCLWDVMCGERISRCPDMRWDGVRIAGLWLPDEACKEHIRYAAVKSLLPEGVSVDYKSQAPYGEHGKGYLNRITLTLPNGEQTGGYKSFGTAIAAAQKRLHVTIAEYVIAAAMRQEAEKCAAQACAQYTAYCNGEVWGYRAEAYEPMYDDDDKICQDHDAYCSLKKPLAEDSCWGFVGEDVKYMVREHVQPFVDRQRQEAQQAR